MSRRRGLRRLLVLGLALALIAGGVYTAVAFIQRSETLIAEKCTAVVGSRKADLATDQAANAALITAVAVRRGLPPRAASIALATAMQESKLRNIGHGDHAGPDSRGLFQQRPSQGWGTEEQVMDPYYSSGAFYDALVKIPEYESLEITAAAQQVQRSAYPQAYAEHEDMGRVFASALTGQSAAALDCTLKSPEEAGDVQAVVDEVAAAFGNIPATADGSTVVLEASGSQAWAVAQWAVANAKSLSVTAVGVEGRSWDRASRNGWQPSEALSGQVRVTVATGTP
ncbi:hypothetical protein ASF98_01980 [Arthrobacter sp. Leaf337]|uniref:hypothetical protein n=1 Tax=Arthrobacter sp. Leaf337 TaxID=1736342 RepID=UPI0006F3ED5D|nr:hypothetical protein [Arthrobacter sp. Leaf337]KQR82793.1 hypothetical protein ASF98_01980 [Arthrobacter sp. Leaf337]